MRSIPALAFVLVAAAPAVASAHIALSNPAARTTNQKDGPCGQVTSVRGSNVQVFEPGATITVTWAETINHPGHYRISFDADGEDFTIPPDYNDFSLSENVIAENIADGMTAQTITLPDIECENCTLQLIQMMTDKPPYGDGNDIYFQCSDIALRSGGVPGPDAGGGNPADPDAGIDDPGEPSDATGGCSAGGRGDFGLAGIALGVAWVMASRRRLRRS
jgi:hypothetical protein